MLIAVSQKVFLHANFIDIGRSPHAAVDPVEPNVTTCLSRDPMRRSTGYGRGRRRGDAVRKQSLDLTLGLVVVRGKTSSGFSRFGFFEVAAMDVIGGRTRMMIVR